MLAHRADSAGVDEGVEASEEAGGSTVTAEEIPEVRNSFLMRWSRTPSPVRERRERERKTKEKDQEKANGYRYSNSSGPASQTRNTEKTVQSSLHQQPPPSNGQGVFVPAADPYIYSYCKLPTTPTFVEQVTGK